MLTLDESPTSPTDAPHATKRWQRRTKILIGAGGGVVALGAAIAIDLAMASTSHGTAHLQGPVTIVDADIDAGSVRLVGTDDSEITIESTVHSGVRSPDHFERVVGDRLVVRSNCPFDLVNVNCSVDYVIRVPHVVAVRARGDGSDFDIAAIHGDVDVSVNGGEVDMSFDAAPRHVKAVSNGGHINIELPDDTDGYKVDAHTNGGSTAVGIRTDPASARTIKAETNGGNIKIRYATASG